MKARLNTIILALVTILSFALCNAGAQTMSNKTYLHKMRLMDSLSIYKMADYDTLWEISVLDTLHFGPQKQNHFGWIPKWNSDSLDFIRINGIELKIPTKYIILSNYVAFNDSNINFYIKRFDEDAAYYFGQYEQHLLVDLWLYKKGELTFSKMFFCNHNAVWQDNLLIETFGGIYYAEMLSAYSRERNYAKAITFGKHLSGDAYKRYEYHNEAAALTDQLETDTSDFKSFCLPDVLTWQDLKQKLNRHDQILYLADRLRLLNCVQPGQPAGITYNMCQYSETWTEIVNRTNYEKLPDSIVSPYNELWKMHLNLKEIKLLLPYLAAVAYIPTYTYFRDFYHEKTLHKLSWVVGDLIFTITGKSFFTNKEFDVLTPDQRKILIDKMAKWCDVNAGLTKEELARKIEKEKKMVKR